MRVRARLDGPPLTSADQARGERSRSRACSTGRGFVEFTPLGFKGAFDLTVTPLNVRATAVLAVESRDGVTGVLVGIEVEFPVPIPLGNSGLGLYGFLGGVGVNYDATSPFRRAGAGARVARASSWAHRAATSCTRRLGACAGAYAFAAGVLLGTAEGGFIVAPQGHRDHRGARAAADAHR